MRNLQINQRVTPRNNQALDSYLREIARLPLLTAEEEVELAERIHNGDRTALERMVKGNLRFVVSVAKNYQNMGIDLADLISAGNMGLITAAERFDATRGFKFCSYAVWWIRQAIIQAISKEGRTIALPANQQALLSKLSKETARMEQELQRTPTKAEVLERLDVDEEHSRWIGANVEKPYSLDAQLQADEDATLIDTIADTSGATTDEALIHESLSTEIGNALAILPQNERDVIKMSFGIEQQHPCTLNEIAMLMGLSRERVRQMRNTALQRLGRSSVKERLKVYL
ncbi:MAG: RNA polymerase sigma factor RpoD/SigA [Bacteroidales bacterium]|nr:RNA polymerase sigma factor RpoD/SigA [Bacteroidales bacterium]